MSHSRAPVGRRRTRRTTLAAEAAVAALRLRRAHGHTLWHALPIYDLAEQMGVEVRFVEVPSLEGMYLKQAPRPTILLSSLRPFGRQAYNCAHELGHHVFGHGSKIDQYLDLDAPVLRFDPEEFIADTFAGFLLMPKVAVERAFARRALHPATCAPVDVYAVAGYFGVGYMALIRHMRHSLCLLAPQRAEALGRVTPKEIRTQLIGRPVTEDVLVVDEHWMGRAVGAQMGDVLLVPSGALVEGRCLATQEERDGRAVVRAVAPGIGRMSSSGMDWSIFVRVGRRGFVGRSLYRHLAESGEDGDDG